MAEEIIAAEREAEELISAAERRAAELKASGAQRALKEAGGIIESANRDAEKIIALAESAAEELKRRASAEFKRTEEQIRGNYGKNLKTAVEAAVDIMLS